MIYLKPSMNISTTTFHFKKRKSQDGKKYNPGNTYRVIDLVDVVSDAFLLLHLINVFTLRISSNLNRLAGVSLKQEWKNISKRLL